MADIGLLVLVYIYVIAIFVFSEKFLKDLPSFSRRFVHIMVGNCIFVMPFFNDPYAMVWFLTLPITIAAFLLTKYSPIKIKSGVTDAGHALGLVYYAGIWTLLIFLLPDKLWIVGVAVGAMVYGDGFASLIGRKWGKHQFKIFNGVKSLEGSTAMLIVSFAVIYAYLIFATGHAGFVVCLTIAFTATLVEAISPFGLDNILVPVIAAMVYFVQLL